MTCLRHVHVHVCISTPYTNCVHVHVLVQPYNTLIPTHTQESAMYMCMCMCMCMYMYTCIMHTDTHTQVLSILHLNLCTCTLLYLSQGVYCKYRFYLDNEDCKTNSVSSTTNPNFNYSKHFSVNPVTQQFLEYLTLQPLIVEVWGQQVETQGSNKAAAATHLLTTRELMNKESAKFGSMVILNPDPQKVS